LQVLPNRYLTEMNSRRRSHPEHIEAAEVELDRLVPGHTPVLPFHRKAQNNRRVLATVPDLERHKLYVGRLIIVANGNETRRIGSIEELNGRFALVRYVD
jgi:hypothetical protein